MSIRLSKKNSIILSSVFFVILAGAGGYLLWRVNNVNTLSEQLTEAGYITKTNTVTGRVTVTDTSTGITRTVVANNNYYTATGMDQNCAEDEIGYQCGDALCCRPYVASDSGSSGPVCGNGSCESGETLSSCPADCSVCGDNQCTGAETLASCPKDCSVCGDNQCTGSETLASCVKDCAVCGDNICSSTETSESCPKDCLCKDLTWTNKPEGTYPTDNVFSGITITNINSKSSTATGITAKLNSTALQACTDGTETCYTVSTNESGYQVVAIKLFNGNTNIEEGTYTLDLVLPVDTGLCASSTVSTSATFVIKKNAVVTVPETGIFDGTLGKVYLGTGFVLLGILTTQTPKLIYAFNTISKKVSENQKSMIEKREYERIGKKRSNFEKKFK